MKPGITSVAITVKRCTQNVHLYLRLGKVNFVKTLFSPSSLSPLQIHPLSWPGDFCIQCYKKPVKSILTFGSLRGD
ncbi:hypothetical protein J6590_057593 [Homalodisca vitripennis]|nr:hypothetical protein J6590_057593 [Homalodisca vitripennis]